MVLMHITPPICLYVYMYTYIYVYIYICIYRYVYMHIYMYIHVYIYIYTYIYDKTRHIPWFLDLIKGSENGTNVHNSAYVYLNMQKKIF
jgi:hypothetical protein